MSDWSADHQCPDCERTLKPALPYHDVCPMCGQLVLNVDRMTRLLKRRFAPDPPPPPLRQPAPLLRTSTAGKRKARPGPGQGVLI